MAGKNLGRLGDWKPTIFVIKSVVSRISRFACFVLLSFGFLLMINTFKTQNGPDKEYIERSAAEVKLNLARLSKPYAVSFFNAFKFNK